METLSRSVLLKLLILVCAGAAVVLTAMLMPGEWLAAAEMYGNYWVCAAMFSAFGFLLWRMLRGMDFRALACRHRWGLVTIVVCTALLHLHEPHRFKVLFDEHALSATAMQMHTERTAGVPLRAHYITGRLLTMNEVMDKRRPLYSFLISVLHDTTGFRPSNALIVNAILGVVLLGLVYGWGVVIGGPRYGLLGVLLLSSLPLLAQNVTGGGLDLLNLTLVMALVPAFHYYLTRPGSEGLDMAIVLTVMLATVRHESIVYLAALGAVVLHKWWHERRITVTWFAAFSPLLLLTTIYLIFWPKNEVYFAREEGVTMFGLDHLIKNSGIMAYYLFAPPGDNQSNSVLLSLAVVLGVICLLLLLLMRLRNIREWPAHLFAFVPVLLVGLGVTLLTQAYFWGQLDDPAATRFILTFFLLGLICALLVPAWEYGAPRIPNWLVAGAAGWLLLVTVPQNTRHFMSDELMGGLESEWWFDWTNAHATQRDLILMVSPSGSILHGHPTVDYRWVQNFNRFSNLRDSVECGVYDNVYLLERAFIDPQTGNLIEGKAGFLASDDFVRDILLETRFRPNAISRISRVTGLRDAEGNAVPFESRPAPPFETEAELTKWYFSVLP